MQKRRRARKPFAWYGGKEALASTLLALLPTHKVYCEVFGGSGALLFGKEPSRLEIFNDLDSGVVNFFRVLRNPQQATVLQQMLTLTPYAREEYYDCLEQWKTADDPVEQARQWYTGVMQSMNSSIRSTGWSSTKVPGSNPALAWTNHILCLETCVRRLAQVQIDHRDFEQVIRAYDSFDTCFYLDPPYVPDTRQKRNSYHYEMSLDDHKRLLRCIQHVQGMVILSGYAHPMYHEALTTWERLTLTVRCSSATRPTAIAQGKAPEGFQRTECIWMNAACVQNQPSLFHYMNADLPSL